MGNGGRNTPTSGPVSLLLFYDDIKSKFNDSVLETRD
jgi:hypothetical protein